MCVCVCGGGCCRQPGLARVMQSVWFHLQKLGGPSRRDDNVLLGTVLGRHCRQLGCQYLQ
jgi:hypothetical protein